MTNQEALTLAKDIITKSMFSAFATMDENGYPQSRAMMPVSIDDDLTTYYITSRASAKCGQIAANAKVSSFWMEIVDPMNNWRSALAKGEARVSDEKSLRERFWVEEIRQFFPGGVDDPNYVVVIVKPIELILASHEMMPPLVVKL
ncbi:MAG: pyridoxamine 5'-phosphate oxidase family protein [Armatimonadetes bacterium]|nr:pyridoxamine 5'-phosphate oxidase family protein [Armatimonadota bacterium]